MAGLLRCLLRVCFEAADEQESDDSYEPPQPPGENRMSRLFRPCNNSSGGVYEVASSHDDNLDSDISPHQDHHRHLPPCCEDRPSSASEDDDDNEQHEATAAPNHHHHHHVNRIREFFAMVKDRLKIDAASNMLLLTDARDRLPESEALSSTSEIRFSGGGRGLFRRNSSDTELTSSHLSPPPSITLEKATKTKSNMVSPLRDALTFGFDNSQEVPAIPLEQIVMPGSDLQQQMAKAMSQKLFEEEQDFEDECVICMEGFDPTNPRMPTLCGCGENKTYFHLPCLYQWIEQSRNCPSCRKRLRWEEF